MGDVGFSEILIIAIVAILIYGKDLPSVARKVGSWYVKLKRHLASVKEEIARQIPIEEIREELNKAVEEPAPQIPYSPPEPGPSEPKPEKGDAPPDPPSGT